MDSFKQTGLKRTLPRVKILELFQRDHPRHLTAEDVVRDLTHDGNEVGLATVYRVLSQFEQAGLLRRSHFEGGRAVYEINPGQHHDHLICLDCGQVEEFYDPQIEACQEAIANARGFRIADHALSLYAHCTRQPCPHRQTVPSSD